MKSDVLKDKIETLPHRSLLYALGLEKNELKKPFIGILNTWNDINPGQIHLNELVEQIKKGIVEEGGVPFTFGSVGVCDGIAMGVEMRYSLPSRDLIAGDTESMMLSHSFDGLVTVTNCDKSTPGALMAIGRLNLPSIMVTGGPMKAGVMPDDTRCDVVAAFEAVGKVSAGNMAVEKAEEIANCCCPGAGCCAGLFTANTMALLAEVLGLSLSDCGAAMATNDYKKEIAYESGKRIVHLVNEGVAPREMVTKKNFENAIMLDLAMGGSSNTVLHLIAAARQFGVELTVDDFDAISKTVPNICSLSPAGPYFMEDVERAGGVPAVLNVLKEKLNDYTTVSGKTILEIAETGEVKDPDVIRGMDNPYKEEGGIAILKGNLANSSVMKQSAVSEDMLYHKGPAKVFDSEKDAMEAILSREIEEESVIVLRYVGPKGAPGMPEMLSPTSALMGAGYTRVSLITDGRFSGASRGPCVGHVEPEGYMGGPIALIEDGDVIEIDCKKRAINVIDVDLEKRKESWRLPDNLNPVGGWLSLYRNLAASAREGAWMAPGAG